MATDLQHVIDQLQDAARLMQVADASAEQRRAAEARLLELRRSAQPYELCKSILEWPASDAYLLFEATTALKEALVREWHQLDGAHVASLRAFLLQYVLRREEGAAAAARLPGFVREQVLHTVAIIVKRSSAATPAGGHVEQLLAEVEHLMASGHTHLQLLACAVLTALLNEYASGEKSSKIGLTWEAHFKCRRHFEENGLLAVWRFCRSCLEHVAELGATQWSAELQQLCRRVLHLAEAVLTWDFLPVRVARRLVGRFLNTDKVLLRPNAAWRPLLTDGTLLALLVKIHLKVRLDTELGHLSGRALAQLASLGGAGMFSAEADKTAYLTRLATGLLELLHQLQAQAQPYELEALSLTLHHLVSSFNVSTLPEALAVGLLEQLCALTARCAELAALEAAECDEERRCADALDRFLDVWSVLLLHAEELPRDALRSAAVRVLEVYVRAHLAAPAGWRNRRADGSSAAAEDDDEVLDLEEQDWEASADSLLTVGGCARQVPERSLRLLAGALEERCAALPGALATGGAALSLLFEDLHWLLLLAGFTLTEHEAGEAPLIPPELMRYSCAQAAAGVDRSLSLQLLGDFSVQPEALLESAQLDDVIRLLAAVFRCCWTQMQLPAPLLAVMSPQLAADLGWLLTRLAKAYFGLDEAFYDEISPTIHEAFGQDTRGPLLSCLSFVLRYARFNLEAWSAEPQATMASAQLLLCLTERKGRVKVVGAQGTRIRRTSKLTYMSSLVIQCAEWWALAAEVGAQSPLVMALPQESLRVLVQAMVQAGRALDAAPQREEEYWRLLVAPLCGRLGSFLAQREQLAAQQNEALRQKFCQQLDMLNGAVRACTPGNLHLLFACIQPLLTECSQLTVSLDSYAQVLHNLLELFLQVVQSMIFYLKRRQSMMLYENCLSLIRNYAQIYLAKPLAGVNAQEERAEGVTILLQLLTQILSKDFLEIVSDDEDGEADSIESMLPGADADRAPRDPRVQAVSAADVVLVGLENVLPLLTAELLLMPNICDNYYKLVGFVGEVYPAKVCCLPAELQSALLSSVDAGVDRFGTEASRASLELLTSLAEFLLEQNLSSNATLSAAQLSAYRGTAQALAPLLRRLLQSLASESAELDAAEAAAGAAQALICLHKALYRELVTGWVGTQSEPAAAQRLLAAFQALTPDLDVLDLSRAQKLQFVDRFERFLLEVRAFLCVR